MQLESPAFILGTVHHDEGGQRPDLRENAQNIGVEMLVGDKIRSLDPQEVFDRPGDVVTLAHLRCVGDGVLERVLCGFGMGILPYGDVGDKSDTHLRRVDHRAVALDPLRPFKVLHPAYCTRRRQADGDIPTRAARSRFDIRTLRCNSRNIRWIMSSILVIYC
jgi:hypothetical protein